MVKRPFLCAARASVSSLAIASLAFGTVMPATATAQTSIDDAVDRSEVTTAYHAVQGYQLDTPDSSLSGARRVKFGRKRLGDKSIVIIDKGNGVQLSGINQDMIVMPYVDSGRERDTYGYDWDTKNMFAKSSFSEPFNRVVAPYIRGNRNQPKDAVYEVAINVETLSAGEMKGGDASFRFTREFAEHEGKTYVLIGYDVPAFQYTNLAGQAVLHWASGFIITDPAFATLYYYGAKNMGTRQPMTQFSEPLSSRMFTFATDETGNRLLDISSFKKAQALIDKAVQGGTDYAPTKRAATPQPLHDTGFFQMARMVDMAGSGIGENSGNQASEGGATGWTDVGSGGTQVAQVNNGIQTVVNVLRLAGNEKTQDQARVFRSIFSDSYEFWELQGLSQKSYANTMTGLADWWKESSNSSEALVIWFEEAMKGNIRSDGIGQHMTRFFGSTADEVAGTFGKIGLHTLDGIGKIAGPIAWGMSAYTVSRGFDYDAGVGSYKQRPDGSWYFEQGQLIGLSSAGWGFVDRVLLDVGAGLLLDLATADVIGFGLDGTAIVVKSFTDIYRAAAYYGNSLKDQQFSEATRAEILGNNYKRQVPLVKSNLPGLLSAEANRTGKDWNWAIEAGATNSGQYDWKKFRYSLPFDFEVVEWNDPQNLLEDLVFGQAQQKVNADKLTELNFQLALMRYLQKRNPTVPENPPGTEPKPEPEPEPDDPGSTGTVTTTETETREPDPGSTGTVTTTETETREPDPGPTGTVTSGTEITRTPTPEPTPTPQAPTFKKPAAPTETRFGETVIVSANDSRILSRPKPGWYNNLAYDREGNFLGYVPLYFLSKPKPPTTEEPEEEALDPTVIAGTDTGDLAIDGDVDPADDPLTDDPLENSPTGSIFWEDGEYHAPEDYDDAITDILDLLDEMDEEIDNLDEMIRLAEEAERRARGFAGTPLGEKYPNQVDYGDGSYPNQVKIDWEKFDPNANYPNPYSPEWKKWDPSKKYPNQTVHKWDKWDPTKAYPNQVPKGFSQTPYNYDSFQDFIDQNAFKYANLSGFFPPNMAAYEDFIALYGLDYLDALARRAGFPSIWAALGDWEFLAWQSTDKNFINAAMNFTCNVRWGVNYDCIGKNAQERAQLELGRILNESRGLFSDAGLSDITISSSNLRYMLRDFGVEDGDIVDVTVTQFGRTIFTGRTNLTNAGTSTSVNVRPGVSSVELTAVNEGRLRPNTAEINFENVTEGEAVQTYSLSEGETGTLKVRVQP